MLQRIKFVFCEFKKEEKSFFLHSQKKTIFRNEDWRIYVREKNKIYHESSKDTIVDST